MRKRIYSTAEVLCSHRATIFFSPNPFVGMHGMSENCFLSWHNHFSQLNPIISIYASRQLRQTAPGPQPEVLLFFRLLLLLSVINFVLTSWVEKMATASESDRPMRAFCSCFVLFTGSEPYALIADNYWYLWTEKRTWKRVIWLLWSGTVGYGSFRLFLFNCSLLKNPSEGNNKVIAGS